MSDFVRERIEHRNESLAERNDLLVAINPEILKIVERSTSIGMQVGNSAMLCKMGSKRRRTRAEILEFRALEESQAASMVDKDARIRELEQQVN